MNCLLNYFRAIRPRNASLPGHHSQVLKGCLARGMHVPAGFVGHRRAWGGTAGCRGAAEAHDGHSEADLGWPQPAAA